jgi:hypothetical protein
VGDDVIGSETERARRRRPVPPGLRLPAGLRRHRRLVAAAVVAVALVGGVAVLRAGVGSLRPERGAGAPVRPLAGSVLSLAAGQNTLYALASDCSAGCRPMLLASDDDGARWTTLDLPGLPSDPSAVTSWQLAVSGVEDSLAVEDDDAGTVTVGTAATAFVTRKITPGAATPRVPSGRESMVRICAAPRCRTPRLDYLEPRTGERGPLLVQPKLAPRAIAAVGSQLWVAGIDPATGRYAVTVSVDDAGSWSTVPLPAASTDPDLVPRIVPVPEQDTAWLVLSRPARRGQVTAEQLWTVPALNRGPPQQVRPEEALGPGIGAVGLKDGRLALVERGLVTVLAQDGVADRMAASDVDSTRYVLREPQRGPHLLFVALAVRTDGVAAIATSLTGGVNDWTIRPVVR